VLSATIAPATLTLQPLTGSLTAGIYTATVQVLSSVASNSPQTISVSFTVAAPPPQIALSSSSLTFNATWGAGNPASQAVNITNAGGGTLSSLSIGTITYGSGAGWLQTPVLSATIAPATLTLQPLTGSLAAGIYTATVQVLSSVASNSPRTINVSFEVEAANVQIGAPWGLDRVDQRDRPMDGNYSYAATWSPTVAAAPTCSG
jgi:hypothetical protein